MDAPPPRLPRPAGTAWLDRFTVKPHHLDAYLPLWRREAAVRERHGFVTHQAFVETDAEPKLTWLLSHPGDSASAFAAVEADPETAELDAARAPHVFRNRVVRPVDVELLAATSPASAAGRTVVVRRYAIVNGWTGFLDAWRPIVGIRERYGFRCLFAVADRPHDVFTWAFDFVGAWADFPAVQRDYYHDPDRVALRRVFDYMADYALHPARQVFTGQDVPQ